MAVYQLPYGHQTLTVDLLNACHVDWIEPRYVAPAQDPLQVVREAVQNPVDGQSLRSYANARSVVIAVNDKTRPVPHEHLLPPLLDELRAVGIPDQAIALMIATGTHVPMQPDEFQRILPEDILERYQVYSHNCDDLEGLVALGTTTRGTPVWVNKRFFEADLRIVVGNIEPHHFAGFSGGYKTAAIGLAGRATINPNHAMLIDPDARIAEFAHNPLRQDIEEIGDQIGVHFALNAILNGEKKIDRAVFGSPRAVITHGIPISQEICQVQMPKSGDPKVDSTTRRYDLVIASVGGAPKDINFYQSQKALTHASLFTRDGGVIILVAECPEGSGNRAYEEFMQGVTSADAVFSKFREMGFRVGPHKAFQVARDVARVKIILVSTIPANVVTRLLMTSAGTADEAFAMAIRLLSPTPPEDLRIAILPRATNTIPV